MSNISKLIDFALSQLGYKESGNNLTKYSEEIDRDYPDFYNTKKQGAAWCDIFVDYCFIKTFGYEAALKMLCQPQKSAGAGCKYSAEYYKQAGRFFTDPQPGDQIFFYSSGDINHTGIVTKVADKVYTIEGNSEDSVKTHSYSLTSKKIAGYGRPLYEDIQETEQAVSEPDPIHEKSIDLLAKEVMAGKYGNGEERKAALGDRYEEVQKKVNELYYDVPPDNSWIGIVTTSRDPLRVRSSKSTANNKNIVRLLPKGSEIELTGSDQGGWYQLADNSGYVSSRYITKK